MATLAHLSDIHFGDACLAALRRARAALEELRPDCIVVSGDITQAGRRREFAEAAAWLSSLSAPVVACPGNHDAPVFSLVSRIVSPFGRFHKMGLADRWVHNDGGVAVVGWNSARAVQRRLDWSQGVHAPEQLEVALDAAGALAPGGWRVLACHHPPGAPAEASIRVETVHAARTRDRLAALKKTILLCGHVHRFSKEAVGEALIITAPTLASSRLRGESRGFVLLHLAQDQAGVSIVSV